MRSKQLLVTCIAALVAPIALAHEGHGVVGSVGHDLQHQVWTFAALVVVAALLLTGERVAAVLRQELETRRKRRQNRQ
jgi:hypothetical protein